MSVSGRKGRTDFNFYGVFMKTSLEVASLLKAAEELKNRAEGLEKKFLENEAAKAAAEKEVESVKANSLNFTYGNRSNSDEQRALSAFGVSNVAQLIRVNTGAPHFAGVNPELKAMVRNLKRSVDTSRAIAQMFHGAPLDHVGASPDQDRIAGIKNLTDTYFGRNELLPRLKAFGTTVADYGAEFVPTLLSAQYIEEYELEPSLQSRFTEIKMPQSPYEIPVVKDVLKAQRAAEGAAAEGRQWKTSKLVMSAKKLECFHQISEELNEDSAPDFLKIAQSELIRAHSRAVEAAIISGDSTGPHIDADIEAGSPLQAEKLWNGLRTAALGNSANGGTLDVAGAFTYAKFLKMRAQMKRFGVDPSQLVIVCGPAVYAQLMGLEQVATVDKFGPNAGILKGALSALGGLPIVVSQHLREDLAATGVFDGAVSSKGSLLIVNASRWMVGMRRAPQLRIVQDLPTYDRYLLAAYQRLDFVGHAQSAKETSVCYGVNITL